MTSFFKLRHDPGGLDRLARDVERHVFRIDHALHKPQVFGQQVAVVFLDQHFAGVELQPVFFAQREQVPLGAGGTNSMAYICTGASTTMWVCASGGSKSRVSCW